MSCQLISGSLSTSGMPSSTVPLDTGYDDPRYLVHWPGRLPGVVLCSDLGGRIGSDSRIYEPRVTTW